MQRLIYDNDSGQGVPLKDRTFNVAENRPVLLRAAGLGDGDEVRIYHKVGECAQCRPNDIQYEVLQQCGQDVILTNENRQAVIYLPGSYVLGDPWEPELSFDTDVNISEEKVSNFMVDQYTNCANNLDVCSLAPPYRNNNIS